MTRRSASHRLHRWVLPSILAASSLSLGAVALGEPAPVLEPVALRAPEPPPEPEAKDPLATPRPDEWQPPARRCRSYRGRRYCDGPRRVPKPDGAAAERAERLGLGEVTTANALMTGRPEEAWVQAAARAGEARETLLWPVEDGRFGRGFGYVRQGRPELRHDGVDIPAEPGTPVRAVNDGIVAYAGNGVRGMGNLVLVVHPDGSVSLYAHLEAAYLFAGQRVRRGQVIGEVGNTGLSRGPHLHFEWRVRGRPRDPARRFADLPANT